MQRAILFGLQSIGRAPLGRRAQTAARKIERTADLDPTISRNATAAAGSPCELMIGARPVSLATPS
jgi:hypothetical protein